MSASDNSGHQKRLLGGVFQQPQPKADIAYVDNFTIHDHVVRRNFLSSIHLLASVGLRIIPRVNLFAIKKSQ